MKTKHMPPSANSVMHVISDLDVGGAENMLAHLVEELENRDVQQFVVNLKSGGANERRIIDLIGDRYTACKISNFPSAFSGFLTLRRAIAKAKPKNLQGWMYHGDLFATLAYLSLFSPKGTKLFWGIRCSKMDFSKYSFQLKTTVRLCRFLSSLPHRIISNSEAGLRSHVDFGYDSRRLSLVKNCVDIGLYNRTDERRATIRAQLGIPEDSFVFCIVARTDPMKGYETFLEVAKRMPEAIALAAGLGTDKLHAPPNFIGLGVRQDIPDILSAADALISTSLFGEGQSNSILEALASGLPVIATDIGDARTLVGEGGRIVAPGDVQGFVDALTHLSSNPAERSAIGQANRLRMTKDYSPSGMADNFLRIYAVEWADEERE